MMALLKMYPSFSLKIFLGLEGLFLVLVSNGSLVYFSVADFSDLVMCVSRGSKFWSLGTRAVLPKRRYLIRD